MSLDLPGFADPVADAQATFRSVLDALAHPGRIAAAGTALAAPPSLHPATAAVLLTLADGDTPLWLPPAFAAARDWLAFHCGVPFVATPAAAAFALADDLPAFDQFGSGSDVAPEDSTTLILQVAALGTGAAWRLSGPGLRTPETLAVTGLPDDFAARWASNHALYPRGIDLLLCCGRTLAALPRSVSVQEG